MYVRYYHTIFNLTYFHVDAEVPIQWFDIEFHGVFLFVEWGYIIPKNVSVCWECTYFSFTNECLSSQITKRASKKQ